MEKLGESCPVVKMCCGTPVAMGKCVRNPGRELGEILSRESSILSSPREKSLELDRKGKIGGSTSWYNNITFGLNKSYISAVSSLPCTTMLHPKCCTIQLNSWSYDRKTKTNGGIWNENVCLDSEILHGREKPCANVHMGRKWLGRQRDGKQSGTGKRHVIAGW